jgi:ectoine hydroxylase-related dioxygenase (phytanoyl-CoA dioxygenase family)
VDDDDASDPFGEGTVLGGSSGLDDESPFMLVVLGVANPATHPLGKGAFAIGRDDSCDIVIRHPSLSRKHAMLRLEDEITIEDLGSTNGTHVDGERIPAHRRTPLRIGEVVHVGSTLVFVAANTGRQDRPTGVIASEERRERSSDRAHLMTPEQRRSLEDNGFLVVPNALSPARLSALHSAIDRAIGVEGKGREHNRAAILGLDQAFLDLVDLETIFPKICQLLGWNIWVNHTHFNVNPPDKPNQQFMYGWHRDGGAIHPDLGAQGLKASPVAIKVGFYLTDVDTPNRGQTYVVPGGHAAAPEDPQTATLLRRDGPWARAAIPPNAVKLNAKAGTAVIFHNRLIHSVRSPNTQGPERRALFVQWAYRWMQPVDPMDVAALEPVVRDPVRRQLLGFGGDEVFVDGYAQGRSRRYYPSADSVPVRNYCIDTLGLPPTGSPW